MSEIPVIDIGPFRLGRGASSRAVAREVDRALREIGFFIVTGHGVDAGIADECARAGRRFFDGPLENKRAVANRGVPFRGYVGYGGENLSYTDDVPTPPDLKEYYSMGRPDLSDPYYRRAELAYTFKPNVWPASDPGLRPAMERHYRSMEALTDLVMQVQAIALDLPEDHFVDKFDHHDSTLRVANYPHQDRPPEPGQLRAGVHTDYGAITLLKAERAPGGLQVETRAGAWVAAPAVPGGFIVNIGDLMMTWTNDRWLSTRHRVVNPPPDATGSTRRLSLVYFANCNPDALIECLPTCTDADHPALHPPITAGEHRRFKIEKSTSGPATATCRRGERQ
ncbi:MAG: isopenicillin N synthase family dioxygenase [Gammaproteobacteria bacterium]